MTSCGIAMIAAIIVTAASYAEYEDVTTRLLHSYDNSSCYAMIIAGHATLYHTAVCYDASQTIINNANHIHHCLYFISIV